MGGFLISGIRHHCILKAIRSSVFSLTAICCVFHDHLLWLKRVHLDDFGERMPSRPRGGQRRRAAPAALTILLLHQ